jgi:dsRNA-specific ribonuclease
MDNIVHNINYSELAQEIKARKESIPEAPEKEIVSNIISQKISQVEKPAVSSQPQPQPQSQSQSQSQVLPSYLKDKDPSIKNEVESLVNLTLEKGLEEGIKIASKKDPFILDAYHDALSDVLIEELKKRNLI